MSSTLVIDLPPDAVYKLLLNFLSGQPKAKPKKCAEPNHLEFNLNHRPGPRGSIWSIDYDITIDIEEKDGESKIVIHFDFTKFYTHQLLLIPIVIVFVIIVFYVISPNLGSAARALVIAIFPPFFLVIYFINKVKLSMTNTINGLLKGAKTHTFT